jgi:putative tryptophan/tyrosine transport system substrate-binding protein
MALAVAPRTIRAQERRRPLVGFLSVNVYPEVRVAAFMEAMRLRGWTHGRDFDFAHRSADGFADRIQALAREVVQLGPAVILVGSATAASAARLATTTIPIVVVSFDGDPVALGFAQSIPHPGGNLTGLLGSVPGLSAKLIQLTHELVPSSTRIGVLLDRSAPGLSQSEDDAAAAARALGVSIEAAVIGGSRDEVPGAIAALVNRNVQALVVQRSAVFMSASSEIAATAERGRLPAVYPAREYVVQSGGLMSYGTSLTWSYRQSALYVDKILKGTKAGDLPFEFPSRLELVINLKAAEALGLSFPDAMWIRADEIIE